VSYVTVVPEAMTAAASDLANLGSTISEAHTAAAASTTSVVAAAQDEVSTAIAALFSSHAQQFQALSAKAAAFHDQFVHALTGGAASYVEADAANMLRLMAGHHAAASAAAALSNAAAATSAEDGDFIGLIFRLFTQAVVKVIPQLAGKLGSLVDAEIRAQEAARQAARRIEEGIEKNAFQFEAAIFEVRQILIAAEAQHLANVGREVDAIIKQAEQEFLRRHH
jgi:hypothetical protein